MAASRARSISDALLGLRIAGPQAISTRLRCVRAGVVSIRPDAFFGFQFGAHSEASLDARIITVPLEQIGDQKHCELWAGSKVLDSEWVDQVGTVRTEDHIVVHCHRYIGADEDVSAVTLAAYTKLLRRVQELGYPHPVRIWNFIPGINRGEHDDETYVRFNRGRAAAFSQSMMPVDRYPAATAVGSPVGSAFTVIVLASRTEPRAIENPRQTSAYRYPRQFGPSPPAFARATLLPEGDGAKLFISGTASIVGHESQHHDIEQQIEETFANIELLKQSAVNAMPGMTFGRRHTWRIYLRNPADLARVERGVARNLNSRDTVAYLHADICRRELLVEVEGICGLTNTGRAPRS